MDNTQGAYFYFVGIATPDGRFGEVAGTCDPKPGTTLLDLFTDIRAKTLTTAPPRSVIVSFTFGPNQIGA